MLLAIDVGNSNTVLGLYDGDKLIYDWRIRTVANHTIDEYGMLIVNLYKTVKSKSLTGHPHGNHHFLRRAAHAQHPGAALYGIF